MNSIKHPVIDKNPEFIKKLAIDNNVREKLGAAYTQATGRPPLDAGVDEAINMAFMAAYQRIATAHEEAHGTAVSKVVFDDMCAGIFLSAYRLVQNLKEFNPNADKQMAGAYREVLDRFLRQTRGNDVNEIVKKQRRSKPSLCRITK